MAHTPFDIIKEVVEGLREVGYITAVNPSGANYVYTAANTLNAFDYIKIGSNEDLIVLEATPTTFILDTEVTGETEYTANAPYFMHEKIIKAANRLTEKDNQSTYKWQKYPLVLFVHPYEEFDNRNSDIKEYDFEIYVLNCTKPEYYSDERYENNFDTIINPICEGIKNGMLNHCYVFSTILNQKITDLLHIDKNPFPDYLDGKRIQFTKTEIL